MSKDSSGLLYFVAIGAGLYVAYSVFSGFRAAGALAGGAANAVAGKVLEGINAINPANPENVVNRAANALLQTVTGDSNATIGTKFYALLHGDSMGADAPTVPTGNALVRSFGGDKLTREDQVWMKNYIDGFTVDPEQGTRDDFEGSRAVLDPQSMGERIGASVQSYGAGFNMRKL